MTAERLGITSLWTVFTAFAGLAVVYGILQAAPAIATIAAAVIAAAAGIMAAILNHTLTQLREQETERNKRKQENYRMILDQLATYIRAPAEHRDLIASANLLSWVVGSPGVVQKTIAFLNVPETGVVQDRIVKSKADLLRDLLLEMRRDLGMSEQGLEKASLEGTFPAIPTPPKGTL
jgi:hypothetical protein